MSTEEKSKEKYELTSLGIKMVWFTMLLLITTALIPVYVYGYSWTAGVKIRDSFRDPLLLAENTWSAETAIEYVQIAIDNIETLGLEPADYHTIFPWGKTFANSIENTYVEMHSSIELLEDIVRWKEKQYDMKLTGTGEIIEDLYHAKMYNYHAYVNTVSYWTGDIDDAYALKNGYYLYYLWPLIGIADIIWLIGVVACLAIRDCNYRPFRTKVRAT